MNSSRLSAFCDRALEAGWLLGVTITPVFFNVYSSRVFEPDKLTTLRSLALIMAVLWLVRLVEELMYGEKPLRFSWRTPMVLAATLTMVLYSVSSIFSLVPYTSFIGSYQRLQGTFTLFGYLVIFFAILTSLRTREQLSRLITVLILNSLPVALYGIIQHNGLDPLPWAGDVQTRVASNMGNAIFVAAYLIMIVPLTVMRIIESFRDILGREQARISDILRASAYIFLLAVQLLTIWYSRSRGPWLGTVTLAFLLPYLALINLQRNGLAEQHPSNSTLSDIFKGIGFGLGTMGLAGLLVGIAIVAFEGTGGLIVGGGLGILTFGGLWLYFVVERKGWRWLWISWGTVGLAAALALVAINVPGPLQEKALSIKATNRLAKITQLESGTGKVRVLIWQGAIDLISIHDPIEFPDGTVDRFNALRPLIGYGPESMYVAYNSFYPAELGHYESRTASPDRSHNETLDSIVITGYLGLAIYLFTFGSVFYWGFRWLGLLENRNQLLLYLGVSVFSAVALYFIGLQIGGQYLFAVAIPLGFLVGTGIYLTVQAFRMMFKNSPVLDSKSVEFVNHPHAILIMAILSSVMGHFVEINFGISIAATRTTFWAMAGMLAVLGLNWVPGEVTVGETSEVPQPEIAAVSSKKPRQKHASSSKRTVKRASSGIEPWLVAVLALSLAGMFLLGTLAYDFINNPDRLSDSGEIFVRSLTILYTQERISYGALMIFLFTWLLFGVVGLSEFDREGLFDRERNKRWLLAVLIYGGVSLLGLIIFGSIFAGLQARLTTIQPTTITEVVDVAITLAGVLGRYYMLIFFCQFFIALFLVAEERTAQTWGHPLSLIIAVVGILLASVAIRYMNYDLIRADIVYKQGGVFANSRNINEKQIGIEHFYKAIEYTRDREDYYYLFLGKAFLELIQGLPSEIQPEQRQALFEQTEEILSQAREINPLNTDHSANLARFYKSWASIAAKDVPSEAADPSLENQEGSEASFESAGLSYYELLDKSLENYEIALILSPQNPIIWNEKAMLAAFDLQDEILFQETISKSLEVDNEFEQTWMLLGDFRSSQGDTSGAIEAYQQAVNIKSDCNVYHVLGTLQAQQSLWEDSITTLETAVVKCSTSSKLWDMYRVLSIAYANAGDQSAAIEAARQGLESAPENQQQIMQELLASLQVQQEPEQVAP
ncbi:MAG: hypothetical protein JW981_02595 [Anaerolineae bacterium]|nr:hypothetical protein [Anaerolineae bacterium]